MHARISRRDEKVYGFHTERNALSEEAKNAGIQGRVILQFIIEKDGTPAQPRIVRSVHPLLDKEALRIIRQMPKWTPGKQDGKPQRVLYTIPISFRLPKP